MALQLVSNLHADFICIKRTGDAEVHEKVDTRTYRIGEVGEGAGARSLGIIDNKPIERDHRSDKHQILEEEEASLFSKPVAYDKYGGNRQNAPEKCLNRGELVNA